MDNRTLLSKNNKLVFPGMECIIEEAVGMGSNVIAYTGRYRDHQNPDLSHRVLIRELFPYDPHGKRTYRPIKAFYLHPRDTANSPLASLYVMNVYVIKSQWTVLFIC